MATMTDRELLELAALAAGIEIVPVEVKNVSEPGDDRFIGYMTIGGKWKRGWFNPIADYGDALLLAVKLGNLDLQWVIAAAWQACETEAERMDYVCRAITRLAAEIGKAMKEVK